MVDRLSANSISASVCVDSPVIGESFQQAVNTFVGHLFHYLESWRIFHSHWTHAPPVGD